jgi:NADP-dependent 3-hydroxy acid dehydrogenase YdfG
MAKNWFISGASKGLGRILTEKLLTRGASVAASLRRQNSLDDLSSRHGERLRVVTLDVTYTDAIRTNVARAFAELGRIDI